MSVLINYKNKSSTKISNNLVLFVDEIFNISGLKKHILPSEYKYILDLIIIREKKNKIHAYDINSKKKIILISIKKI